MAVRVFRFGVVFAIGFCLGPVAGSAVATGVTEIPLSLYLKDPKDVTVARGQSATLRCEATSAAPGASISREWLYGGSVVANDSRHQVLGDGSLYIPKVAGKKMEGQYQCRAKNDVGTVLSNPATLKIATIGREFTEQPKNVSIAEQQSILLPCRIQSTPDAVIHWERDNKSLPHSTRYVPLPLGALLITSTHSSDAGFYRCIATNKILKKTKRSKPGQLTVLPPLRSTESPKFLPLGIAPNVTILVGSNLTLYCAVTGWPTPAVQWFNNMTVVGNSSMLELRNVSADSGGNYSCSASNSVGRIIRYYNVQVEQPPRFNVTPMSISYPPARTVRLDCQVKGIPQPQISWLKNGKPLKIEGRIKLQQSGLVLSHSFTTDKGFYQCVANNSAGSAWVSAQLVPYSSDNIPSPPHNVQCRSFDDNSICLVWSPPANVSIQAYSIYAFSAVPTAEPKDFVTNYTYYLASGLDRSTNYTLYVRSYSKEASDQSNIVSCETGIKGKRDLRIESLTETSVKLTWSEVSNDVPCGSSAAFYKVQWRRMDQPSINMEYANVLKKVVTGLRPLTTYEFRVESTTNRKEDSVWVPFSLSKAKKGAEATSVPGLDSNGISNELNDSMVAVPLTPQQVEADPLSPYSINLTWMNMEEDEDVTFIVCYVELKEEKICEKGQLVRSKKNYLEVKNLKPNTKYELKVRSENSRGISSSFSHAVQVRTFADLPSRVQDLKYSVINITTVCVRWRAPLHKNGKLIKYVLLYTPDQNRQLEQWDSVDVPVLQAAVKSCWPEEDDTISVILSKLKPDARYTVLVRAETEAGLGNPSLPLKFATRAATTSIFYPDSEEEESPASNNHEDLHYKQKLGVALGLSISILCILCCVSCIIFRRRCIKREALARARFVASNNYYPSSTGMPYPGTSLQLRHQESCTAEAHEMQHLIGQDPATHIPSLLPAHLDTKGGVGFPNGQLNGTLKHVHMNGSVANGNVHITENPRYDYHDCNGHINPKKSPKQESLFPSLRNYARHREQVVTSTDFENSSEPLMEAKFQGGLPLNACLVNSQLPENSVPERHARSDDRMKKPKEVCENGKVRPHNTPEVGQVADYNSNCNSELGELYKFRGGSPIEDGLDLSRDDGLNVTQLTCLEDSFANLPPVHRRVSPALGPNG